MRKDELLYVHQLLTAVRSEYERRGDTPAGAFAAYDELSVSPVAAHEQKGKHKRAVLELATVLAACSDQQAATAEGDDQQEVTP